MIDWPTSSIVALAGFAGGVVLGLAARLGRFCTLSAIEDALYGDDLRRLRMWALALGVAIALVAVLKYAGAVAFDTSLYHRLDPNPLAWVVGGLLFGVGMAFCGSCGYGTLVRVGGGDLRALFGFLVIGIAAYMAIAGPTAEFRQAAIAPFALSRLDHPPMITDWIGQSGWAEMALSAGVASLILIWSLSCATFRRSLRHVFWGVMVGLAVVSGWLATGWLGADPFEPQLVMSHTFSVPLGRTLIYVMTMSSSTLTFGIGATFGVIAGAFIGALLRREFRWEGADDAREMRRHLIGAFLMGTGGVYAGGCTIGQGLSAASLLAVSAPVVMLSIWCGVWLGLNYLMEGSIIGGLRQLFSRS